MRPGEHGSITVKASGGMFFASTYVRDADGKRRRVERSSSKSVEDARRILQRHLTNRRAPLSGQAVTERTSLSELFELWVEEEGTLNRSGFHAGFMVEVSPGEPWM